MKIVWTLLLSLCLLLGSSVTLACGKGKSSRHSHSKTSSRMHANRKPSKKASRSHAKAPQLVRELPPKYVKAEKWTEIERLPSSRDVIVEF